MKLTITLALSLLSLSLVPSDALACGGCFAPMGTVTDVSAHRMAFLSSPSGSVLWDQIQYTGSPEDFVWVLPVQGTPSVEVADNGFFEALATYTTIRMTAPAPPRMFCPGSYCPGQYGAYADAGAAAFDASAPSVNVYHEGVVGPYDTATIGSTDSMALVTWLQDHGYAIDAALMPTIGYYVDQGMNFVALRLRPSVGIDRMTPVRIATPGLALTLPLRMVAAGVRDEVALELFVFAEARMEAASFGNAEVDRAAITFDWANRTFDYDARFDDALFSGAGTANNWVTEYALPAPLYSLASYTSGYGTDVHSGAADTQIVMDALPDAYLTRLRTRLPPSQLDTDLTLRMAHGGDLDTNILVTRELHRAPDVVCEPPPPCPTSTTPDAGDAGGGAGGLRPSGGGGCAVGGSSPRTALAIALMVAAFLARRRRC